MPPAWPHRSQPVSAAFGTAALDGQGALQITVGRRLRHRAGRRRQRHHRQPMPPAMRATMASRTISGSTICWPAARRRPTRLAVRPDILARQPAACRAAGSTSICGRAADSGGWAAPATIAAPRSWRQRSRRGVATVARGGLPAGDFTLADYAGEIVGGERGGIGAGQRRRGQRPSAGRRSERTSRRGRPGSISTRSCRVSSSTSKPTACRPA